MGAVPISFRALRDGKAGMALRAVRQGRAAAIPGWQFLLESPWGESIPWRLSGNI